MIAADVRDDWGYAKTRGKTRGFSGSMTVGSSANQMK